MTVPDSNLQDKHSTPTGVHSVAHVDAAALTSKVFAEQYQKPGIPVLIHDVLDTTPQWNLDYLSQHLGTQEFPVRYYGWDRYQQDKRQWTSMGSGVETHTMPFAQYAELLNSGEARRQDLYLGKCSLQSTPLAEAALLQQAVDRLGLKQPVSAFNLWVGLGGHVTCLHCDPFDGVLLQLQGCKKVVLFPPAQLPNLYPFPVLSHLQYGLKRRASYSQVYPEHPDFDAFPKLRDALQHRYEVVLQPRDGLFIPAGWWHEVTTLGEEVVCSVNQFWSIVPRTRALRSWNKWRIHLGSVLATPHILWQLLVLLRSSNPLGELRKLSQRI